MSMDEKDLKKLAEEQSENIKIPDSLQPDQIQQMLESRGQKKRKYYYGKITAAAACGLLVIGAVAAGTVGFGFGTGTKSDQRRGCWFGRDAYGISGRQRRGQFRRFGKRRGRRAGWSCRRAEWKGKQCIWPVRPERRPLRSNRYQNRKEL